MEGIQNHVCFDSLIFNISIFKDFGEADEVTITKDDTLILRGKGDQKDVEKRIAQIQDELETSTSDYEKV